MERKEYIDMEKPWRYNFESECESSVQNILNSLYEDAEAYIMSVLPEYKGKNIFEEYMLEGMQTVPDFSGSFLSENDMDYIIKQYSEVSHTLGNFVFVPGEFSRFSDYWDELLEHLQGSLPDDQFDWYINYFFLWDYVKETDEERYEVKKISPRDEGNTEEFDKFFYNTISIVKRRGMFMTAMLMIRQDAPALYDKLIWLLNCPVSYNGLRFVAEMFLSEFGNGIPDGAKAILEKLEKRLLSLDEIVDEFRENGVSLEWAGEDEESYALEYEFVKKLPDGSMKSERILTNENMDDISFAINELKSGMMEKQ